MKKILLVLGLFCVFAFTTEAQFNRMPSVGVTPFNALTYADDDIDTSGTYVVGGIDQLVLWINVSDSASVVYKFDYRVPSTSAWTAVTAASADTVTKTAAGYAHIILRDNVTERIPGLYTQFRIRAEFQGSANSANSGATHTGKLYVGN